MASNSSYSDGDEDDDDEDRNDSDRDRSGSIMSNRDEDQEQDDEDEEEEQQGQQQQQQKRSRRSDSLNQSDPAPNRPSRKGKEVESRDTSQYNSRGGSLDGNQEEDEEEEEDEEGEDENEPQELDENDLDPINSGAATPGVGGSSHRGRGGIAHYLKRTEVKIKIKQHGEFLVVNDEIVLPDDPKGDEKIDEDGVLLGGRQFKLYTFASPYRPSPNKHYMLSIDAARAAGFRDSLYFFRRNPLILKLPCSQAEKDKLIAVGKLSTNLKSRAVTMVCARNVYKCMGAKFVIDGKYIFDDYYEQRSLDAGHKPGEPAWIETYDIVRDKGTLAGAKGAAPAGAVGNGLNTLLGHAGKSKQSHSDRLITSNMMRDEYNAGGGINSAMFGGTGLQPFAKTWDPISKKARPPSHLTVNNWMMEYAKSVAEHNRDLAVIRRMNLGQVKLSIGDLEDPADMEIELEEDIPEDELELMNNEDSASRSGTPNNKRKVTIYNPIRGAHDPETNVPHVFASTQPTRSSMIQIDSRPRLYAEEIEDDQGELVAREERIKRRKIEKNSAKVLGLATIEYVVEDSFEGREEELLPGMFDFRPIEVAGERW